MNGVLTGSQSAPIENWGDYPEAGYNLRGATSLTFWAKGARGGERVEFFAFGVGFGMGKLYPDSAPKTTLGYVTLTNAWQQFSLDLTGLNLSYVLGGFGWVTNSPQNGYQNITFYLDDIQYQLSPAKKVQRLTEPKF